MRTSLPARLIARLGLIVIAWLSVAGAASYDLGLYIQNILSYPSNVGVSEWWGSELAIRYCAGFVRRGLLGQMSWTLTGLIDQQSAYVVTLAGIMAAASLLLGLILYRLLRSRLAMLPALLILFAPTAFPVVLTHAGSLFRKDAFQLCLFALILYLINQFDKTPSVRRKTILGSLAAVVQVAAVFNHEPFTLLIVPALFLARVLLHHSYRDSLLLVLPSVIAFFIVIVNKGRSEDVSCLQDSLQFVGLLSENAMPGSSITELALTKPSFFTWDLSIVQLSWSLLHGILAICVTLSCYLLIVRRLRVSVIPSHHAALFLLFQLVIALPLFMATIDYGRWFAMLACAGMLALLSTQPVIPRGHQTVATEYSNFPSLILCLSLFLIIPSHCCTYEQSKIFAFVPYAGLSVLKSTLHALI